MSFLFPLKLKGTWDWRDCSVMRILAAPAEMTWVQFPAPTQRLTASELQLQGFCCPLLASTGIVYPWYIHISIQALSLSLSHTNTININVSEEMLDTELFATVLLGRSS